MAIPTPYLNRPARSRLLSVPLWILAGALCLPTQVVGADAIKHFRLEGDKVVVEFENSPGQYFFLQQSLDYEHWEPADMSLGAASQTNVDLSAPRMFLRVIPYSLFAPLDSDGDGMDDVYELSHRDILNPLDPADGSKLTPGGSGLTNYQHYLKLFGIDTYKILQRETREVSLFNFGSPSATFEANTREQSVFNFGSPSAALEADSKEISIYNGEQVPYSDLLQIETREVSVFNFGGAAPGVAGGRTSGSTSH